MQRLPRSPLMVGIAGTLAAGFVLVGCGGSPAGDEASAAETSARPAAQTVESSIAVNRCAKENLTTMVPGTLTIGTDSPAFPPYFVDDDPTNGQGFESAVAYAVAADLGFTPTEVSWVVVPFTTSFLPGEKEFDFDINQISITPARAESVDFSRGYYSVNQAVVGLVDSPIASVTTVTGLKEFRLGAQADTTNLEFIEQTVRPNTDTSVFGTIGEATSALQNDQIDGIVVDLPTAYTLTATEIANGEIVGQFPAQDDADQFGMLFAQGNPLVTCVDEALARLTQSGELQRLQDTWLAGITAPYFTEE